MIKPIVRELKKRFGKDVFATKEEKTLEEAVVDLLKEKNMTLSLAESCTRWSRGSPYRKCTRSF